MTTKLMKSFPPAFLLSYSSLSSYVAIFALKIKTCQFKVTKQIVSRSKDSGSEAQKVHTWKHSCGWSESLGSVYWSPRRPAAPSSCWRPETPISSCSSSLACCRYLQETRRRSSLVWPSPPVKPRLFLDSSCQDSQCFLLHRFTSHDTTM